MNSVKQAFNALSAEQRAIIRERRVSGARSADDWIRLLGPIAEYDRHADEVRRGGGGFFARRFARKHDLPDGLRQFAMQLLPILREDHDPSAPLELWLDLTGPLQPQKAVRHSPQYSKGNYPKVVDTFYDDPWFQCRARFVDGAHLQVAVVDHVRSSMKTKRNPRGRVKTKVKHKKKTALEVTLAVPSRNYAPASGGRPAPKQSSKPDGDRTKVKLGGTLVADRVDSTPRPEVLLELISGAYERVAPARRKKL